MIGAITTNFSTMPKPKKKESLKEKIRKHVNDKNDKITDQDLRDVIVGTEAVDVNNPDEPTVEKNDIPENIDITTPWDVLEEKKGEE